MKQELLKIISELQKSKESVGKEPSYVTMLEIQERLHEDMKDILNKCVAEGKLEWARTVNHIPMFKVK